MRLFLSSENFGKHPEALVALTGKNKQVAYIGNAKDFITAAERREKVAEHKRQFESLGFRFTELDLRDYFDSKAPKTILDGYGLVWCAGGNTFLLRSAMRLSNFDTILAAKVAGNEIAYGGSSAGAVVAGPTLCGTEHGDDPAEVKRVYRSDVIWDGLGLIDTVVVPHWGSDWFGADAQRMADALEHSETHVKYEKLVDGQVLVLNGDRRELLT